MMKLIRWFVLETLIVLARLTAPFRKPCIPVFVYHSIDHSQASISLAPEIFEQHIDYLRSRRISLLSCTEAIAQQQAGTILRKSAILTFDDAYTTIEPWIENLLSQKETATIFVPSVWIGQSNKWDINRREIAQIKIMTADQLKALKAKGCDFGAHTRTHPNLTEISTQDLRTELVGVREELKEQIDDIALTIAYPYGAHNDKVIETAEKAGYAAGFTTQLGYLDAQTDLLRIPRFPTNISLQVFRLIVHGGYGWYRKLQDGLFG